MAYENFPISSGLELSQYSHVMAKIELRGNEIMMAANIGTRFANSDTPETITAVIRILIMNLIL